MKIADIRVINIDQPRCQIPLVEVETDSGLIGIGATQAPVKPIAALIADIAPLAGWIEMGTLGLGSNKIKDVTPLAGLTKLIHLLIQP